MTLRVLDRIKVLERLETSILTDKHRWWEFDSYQLRSLFNSSTFDHPSTSNCLPNKGGEVRVLR